MASFNSYDLKGKKLSFANWISNLSPTETPFCSMTSKEAVDQTVFFWQTDRLQKAADNAHKEGEDITPTGASDTFMNATTAHSNYTQILRKSFKVSDTANVLANYGRGREVAYQMEKFSLALKRDLETILLSGQKADDGERTAIRKTAGFEALVLNKDAGFVQDADADTGARTYMTTSTQLTDNNPVTHAHIQQMTYNLFLANSEADVIMFHPRHAHFFASLQGREGSVKMFDGDDTEFSLYVNTYIDEFGRSYKLVPNRFMPQDVLYFFKPSDFTQMILRAPQRTELAKKGNYQHWMIEMEVGLRLRDQYAAGVIKIKNP